MSPKCQAGQIDFEIPQRTRSTSSLNPFGASRAGCILGGQSLGSISHGTFVSIHRPGPWAAHQVLRNDIGRCTLKPHLYLYTCQLQARGAWGTPPRVGCWESLGAPFEHWVVDSNFFSAQKVWGKVNSSTLWPIRIPIFLSSFTAVPYKSHLEVRLFCLFVAPVVCSPVSHPASPQGGEPLVACFTASPEAFLLSSSPSLTSCERNPRLHNFSRCHHQTFHALTSPGLVLASLNRSLARTPKFPPTPHNLHPHNGDDCP